jgi:catechol 2,3-dioxygenase-like lactoylglutathione lyase family enzyme
MRWLTVLVVALMLHAPLGAQLPAPNAAGVSAGHLHLIVRDPDVHRKIWVEVLGAQVVNSGSLELLKLPGIFLVIGKGDTTEGSEGTALDHFAFRARDLPAVKVKLAAAGVSIVRDDPREIVAMFPDKVKVEFYAAPMLAVPLEHFHVHFFTSDPDGLRAWYAKHFGAEATTQGTATVQGVPGMAFSVRKTDVPQAATKGRSLDHIGFEVKGLEAFCKKLEAAGVTFDMPFRDVPRIGLKIAFVVDPAGTRVELTEGLAER